MKVKQSYIAFILFSMWVLLSLNPHIFERILFFNELISLAGLMLALVWFPFKSSIDKVFLCGALWFTLTFLVYALSVFTQDNWFAYARHSVIWYSYFCFFVGCFVASRTKVISIFVRSINPYIAMIFLIVQVPIQRIFALPAFPFIFMRSGNKLNFICLYLSLAILTLFYGGTSGVFAILFVAFVFAFNTFKSFGVVLLLLISCIAVFFSFAWTGLDDYLVYKLHPEQAGPLIALIYEFDPNLLTRLGLWQYALKIWASAPILGVGFGVEMYDPELLMLSFVDDQKNAYLGYFLGAHNSVLTLLARTGVITTLLFSISVLFLIKQFYALRSRLFSIETIAFSSFLIALSVLLLNVVLESPIGAGVFWFIFGVNYWFLFKKKDIRGIRE